MTEPDDNNLLFSIHHGLRPTTPAASEAIARAAKLAIALLVDKTTDRLRPNTFLADNAGHPRAMWRNLPGAANPNKSGEDFVWQCCNRTPGDHSALFQDKGHFLRAVFDAAKTTQARRDEAPIDRLEPTVAEDAKAAIILNKRTADLAFSRGDDVTSLPPLRRAEPRSRHEEGTGSRLRRAAYERKRARIDKGESPTLYPGDFIQLLLDRQQIDEPAFNAKIGCGDDYFSSDVFNTLINDGGMRLPEPLRVKMALLTDTPRSFWLRQRFTANDADSLAINMEADLSAAIKRYENRSGDRTRAANKDKPDENRGR